MPTPMTPERLEDRFRFYRAKPHQQQGIRLLHQAIRDGLPPEQVLLEEAPWALAYSQAPLALPPSGGLDPRGAEEEGLAWPAIAAPVVAGDSYLLVNERDQDMEAYDHSGRLLWRVPCLARGQGRDNQWRQRNSDTPPGPYRLGAIYRDHEANPNPPCSDTAMAYGWYSFDMEDLEGQEAANGRAGIMLHGGGSAFGWPGAWQPRQPLHPTLGCLRLHNIDLRDRVLLPLPEPGTAYVGVLQQR